MKTSYNTLVAALAFSFLVATHVRADIITKYGPDDLDTYMQLAGVSEWALVGATAFDREKSPYNGTFELSNVLNQYRDEGSQVASLGGNYTMDSWNGNGSGYSQALTGTGEDMGLEFSHNSANRFAVAVPGGLINAFYLNVGTHANESSTSGSYNIIFYDANGANIGTFENIAFGFTGFIFDEGYYFTKFEITTVGNPNTGYSANFIPGNGIAASPEPTTLALLGLGLAGAGLASRRRRK